VDNVEDNSSPAALVEGRTRDRNQTDAMVGKDQIDVSLTGAATPVTHGQDHAGPLRLEERQDAIVELVLSAGSIRIDDIVEQFSVSRMTIHRDLDALEARGILRKSRGTVTAVASSLFEASTDYRIRQSIVEKQAIARAAFDLVEPGQAIVLDDSTTGLQLAKLLVQKAPLTVITNFNRVITELKGKPGISLLSTGGEYYELCDAYKGPIALNALGQLRTDIYFMSTPAITGGICYHQHPELVLIKQAMLKCAQKKVLIADHTKFRKRALHAMCTISDFDLAIVDSGTSPEELGMLKRADLEVKVAPLRTGLHRRADLMIDSETRDH